MKNPSKTFFEREVDRLNKEYGLPEYQYVYIRQSKAFMEKYYREKIELDEIAAAAFMSRFHYIRIFQKALKDAGIPYTSFKVDDLKKEYERLTGLGVQFSMKPKEAGPTMIAVLDDSCGNNIQLLEMI